MKRRFAVFLFFSFLVCAFLLAFFLLFLNIQKDVLSTTTEIHEQTQQKIYTSKEIEGISVYFTTPEDSKNERAEIVVALKNFLNNAQKSIYGAIYDLDYNPIAELLIHKFRSGVDVKLVIEGDNSNKECVLKCKRAGIPIVEDGNSALMHNKFFVVDGSSVWTGSTNMTYNCLFLNNNNSLVIHSPQLAENYRNEFEEMLTYHCYGMKSPRNTKNMEFVINNDVLITNMFAPEDGVAQRILREIEKTHQSVRFMAFSFTSAEIAARLIKAQERGVIIQGVFEKRNAGNIASKDELLKHAGMEVRWDGNPKTMHHKVMIFDEHIVLTGSYNFTEGAEKRNDENVIIIDNSKIAREYMNEFYRVFEKSIPVR